MDAGHKADLGGESCTGVSVDGLQKRAMGITILGVGCRSSARVVSYGVVSSSDKAGRGAIAEVLAEG